MWNDGPAKQPWLNYFNEYELQHCCFGGDGEDGEGGGNNTQTARDRDDAELGQITGEKAGPSMGQGIQGDPQGYGEDTGLTADQAAEAMAAADAAAAAAAAAGANPEAQASAGQAAADMASADLSGQAIGDIDGGIGLSMEEIDKLEDLGLIGYNERQDLGYFDKLDRSIDISNQRDAVALNKELAAKDLDAQVAVDKFGNYTYTGPDMFSALGGQLGKAAMEFSPTIQLGKTIDELGGISGLFGKAKDSLVSAFSRTPSTSQTLSRLAGSDKDLSGLAGIGEFRDGLKGEKGSEGYVSPQAVQAQLSKEKADRNAVATANQYATDVLGLVDRDAQAYRDALADMNSVRANTAFTAIQTEADKRDARNRAAIEDQRIQDIVNVLDLPSLSAREVRGINSPLGGPRQTEADRRRNTLEKVRAEIEEEKRRQANLAAVEDMLKYRSAGGMVYRNEGGQAKEKSAMELYLEKLGQPSKYTVPDFPMNRPSMTAPPTSSDPFELAEYRKNLARETMGSYLPVDIGGASSAINTFNEDYYGGASNVSPYNVAQLASIYGLDRNPATYEGIIGMLGGVRNELPPPPPEPEPEPEPIIEEEEEDDDNWSYYDEEEIDQAFAKGGGGIRNVLYRN